MKAQNIDFTELYNNYIYIELTELGQDEIQNEDLQNYNGKFSLDIEKENRKKVMKYLLGFVLAAVVIVILSNYLFFGNDQKQKDNSEFQGEIKVNYEQYQIYLQEIQPKYHQGCIQQQPQEKNCLKCIYNSNVQQNKTQQCDSCCYQCLPGQMYYFQKHCTFEIIYVYFNLESLIQSDDNISIQDQEYREENINIDRLILLLKQPIIWKHISITFNYGSIYLSQINYFKDMLLYLIKKLNTLSSILESFQLNAGYISIKDDIYGQLIKYETQFIYEDILNNLKLENLKKVVFNMKNLDTTFNDKLLILISQQIQKYSQIQSVSILFNRNSKFSQNFTSQAINMIQKSIQDSQNLTSFSLEMPLLENENIEQITDLVGGLKQIKLIQELNLSLNLQNFEQSNSILQKVSIITQLTSLKLNLSPISIVDTNRFLIELENLEQIELAFSNLIKISQNFFLQLTQIQKLKEIRIYLSDENKNFTFTDQILSSIAQFASAQQDLQRITLNIKCDDIITDYGINQYLNFIQNQKDNLNSFKLSSQSSLISDSGVQQIILYLQDNKKLQTFKLDLSQNLNISKQKLSNLLKSFSNKNNLSSFSINFSKSKQLFEDENQNDQVQKVFEQLSYYSNLTKFHFQIYSIGQQEILSILQFLQNTNISNLKIIAKAYTQSKLAKNLTQLNQLKFKQNFQKFHLEIQNKQQIFDDEFCLYVTNPLIHQALLKSYVNEIGCDTTQSQFNTYAKIIKNLKFQKNVSIQQNQYPNITDDQLIYMFEKKNRTLDQFKIVKLDLKDQIYLNETSLIELHRRINSTIQHYELVIPKSIQFKNSSLNNISHFLAIQYDIKTIKLEISQLEYNLESLQILFKCISLSVNKVFSYVEIILPCHISYNDISQISFYLEQIQSFYLVFNKCSFDLSDQQIFDLNKKYKADLTYYTNSQLTIQKKIKVNNLYLPTTYI
ncbi:hypothetical protein ABPG74_014134 [Tetrahymena malaccensis]